MLHSTTVDEDRLTGLGLTLTLLLTHVDSNALLCGNQRERDKEHVQTFQRTMVRWNTMAGIVVVVLAKTLQEF